VLSHSLWSSTLKLGQYATCEVPFPLERIHSPLHFAQLRLGRVKGILRATQRDPRFIHGFFGGVRQRVENPPPDFDEGRTGPMPTLVAQRAL
jgi:hypothetical protein